MVIKKRLSVVLITTIIILAATYANASEWQIVGPRALGMGGAHVAVVNDASAQYWNPAAFGFFGRQSAEDSEKKDEHSGRDFGVYAHVGGGFQAHQDILEEIEDIADNPNIDYNTLQADIDGATKGLSVDNVADFTQMIAELEDLSKENMGISAMLSGGVNVRLKNFAVGAMVFGNIAAIPKLDLTNINPNDPVDTGNDDIRQQLGSLVATDNNITTSVLSGSQATDLNAYLIAAGFSATESEGLIEAVDQSLVADPTINAGDPILDEYVEYTKDVGTLAGSVVNGGSFENNSSIVLFQGAYVAEIPISYGHAFSDNLSVGGNIKAMNAETYYTELAVFDSNVDDFFETADANLVESSSIGLDLGVLYKTGPLRFGMVGRNINKPTFDWNGPGDYEVNPQIRAGAAMRLWNWITLAADLDVTENETDLSGSYKSRTFGAGAEFDLLHFLRLRAGLMKNLSENDIGAVYTAGLGINLYLFQLDFGAAMSADKTTIDGNDLPEEVRGELALSLQF